ncbi:SPFH/Band 7/PHB domain protein [Streptobacillus moniliformis]|uniref:Band 7 protein n=2 Tax=Streptobacillus moniliformis TaxID=34105 RepID=D1AVC0_STRM9|nr:SPFH domain-containing protein [Streptobacillus moniliformis]ACZ01680.1 band 7 protein [Streptobacillus moniliformis DSM 12112]AVL43321.1 SPFH/Band 7/PHB domain protein [Streptobacillus moniliformis]QXW66355.1 SPFH/Band 7/PHB domain protein [Streptobacillus moniliformis]SQA13141.1 FtsH protease regulator HflK [Streptobacillus moniliformis]
MIMTIFGIIILLLSMMAISGIRIVPESDVYVIERLGKYSQTLESGLSFINPLTDRVAKKVTLKEQVVDFDPQGVITKDNATMQIDTVVYFQITDPKLFTYGVERPIAAIENLTATTLRNIIGDMTVDQTLTSRDVINSKMRMELDEATDPWGIKVNRVELKSIIPPTEIRIAMEKEMKAEREKRAKILEAQAQKESAILVAEGEKTAAILRAEAKKEVSIKEAEGRAKAILALKEAESEGIKILNSSVPSKEILVLRSLESLEKVSQGEATKIFIPSELQNLTSLLAGIREIK